MTGDYTCFASLSSTKGGKVTFGDDKCGTIIGKGNIGKEPHTCIKDVLLVDGLKHNLLSISHLCDKGYEVYFSANKCHIIDPKSHKVCFVGTRENNIYCIDLSSIISCANANMCLSVVEDTTQLWHKRLGHVGYDILDKLVRKDLVRGLPKVDFTKTHNCDACTSGKQVKTSFKPKKEVSTTRPLQLVHMDLFGPTQTLSLSGSRYVFVIVDDYSRFTWTFFLAHKSDTFKSFSKFCKRVQREFELSIITIRSDQGGELENFNFSNF
nr:DDE-type integrase/transposase/recombinase [Serratia marcescens]